MKRVLPLFRDRLLRDRRGTMAIETAIALPALVLLGLGTFQVSDAVARQTELQSAASEALQIALASKPRNSGDLTQIRSILRASTGLGDNNVTVSFRYRCGTDSALHEESGECGAGAEWTFVRVSIVDTYHPLWTKFGIGSNFNLTMNRTVQIS